MFDWDKICYKIPRLLINLFRGGTSVTASGGAKWGRTDVVGGGHTVVMIILDSHKSIEYY